MPNSAQNQRKGAFMPQEDFIGKVARNPNDKRNKAHLKEAKRERKFNREWN